MEKNFLLKNENKTKTTIKKHNNRTFMEKKNHLKENLFSLKNLNSKGQQTQRQSSSKNLT